MRAEEMRTRSLEEFRTGAAHFVRALVPRKGKGATVVALHGELGAGKTTFVQASAEALHASGRVTSPTFVIQKTYPLPKCATGGFRRLVHIDAYRLGGAGDLDVLRFEETLHDPETLIFIEWAERVAELIPNGATHIYFEHGSGEERTIRITSEVLRTQS